MKIVNFLDFIKDSKKLTSLDFYRCNDELYNFLNLESYDSEFTCSIDLGLIFLSQKDEGVYVVIDGMKRLLSLSLLLHAICECYKKTTSQNEKAIKTIRSKYLIFNKKMRIILKEKDAIVYEKIINGERLSDSEKKSYIFKLLHQIWSQIKNNSLKAADIFKVLQKTEVTLVNIDELDDISYRKLFLKINEKRNINQLDLISSYAKEKGFNDEWEKMISGYFLSKNETINFLKDYFITKFNYKTIEENHLYTLFTEYVESMHKYFSYSNIITKIQTSAFLYSNLLNVNLPNKELNKAFIKIKKMSGEDTYAYILEVFEDFNQGNLSEDTFLEILNTIIEYLINRNKTDNKVTFNELVKYLNAFLSCK